MEDFSSDSSYSNNHSNTLFSSKVTSNSKSNDTVEYKRSIQGVLRDDAREDIDPPSDGDLSYDKDLEQDQDGFSLPQLQESMTPWRSSKSEKEKRESIQLDLMSPLRYSQNRNSLFGDGMDINTTEPTSASSIGQEQLQKQITYYKLKIKTLFELLKQVDGYNSNYSTSDRNSPNHKSKRDSFYQNLLHSITQTDEPDNLKKKIDEQAKQLDEKNNIQLDYERKMVNLNEELELLKLENKETLEYANEYLEHSEEISKNVDELITLLIEKLYKITDEEKNALDKARSISSSFVMVKMNALVSSLRKILDDLKYYQEYYENNEEKKNINFIANSTDLQLSTPEKPLRNSTDHNDQSYMDTKLENAILDIHTEYEDFIQGIQFKLEDNAKIEEDLLSKFSKQTVLLKKIVSKYHSMKADHEQRSYSQKKKVLALHNDLEVKEDIIIRLQEELEGCDDLKLKYKRLNKTLEDEKKLFEIKENNWNQLSDVLEKDISENKKVKENLIEMVEQLNEEIDHLKSNNNQKYDDLAKNYYHLTKKYDTLSNDFKDLTYDNDILSRNFESIQNQNYQLHSSAEAFQNNSNMIIKYETDFDNFKQHLVLHLTAVFVTLRKILQPESIDQSETKLNLIKRLDNLTQIKSMQRKLDSLYTFIEAALESIIDSYSSLVKETNNKRLSQQSHPAFDEERYRTELHDQLQLRIDELERKWISERERRKLDNNAAEDRIRKLEKENELLREQLFNRSNR